MDGGTSTAGSTQDVPRSAAQSAAERLLERPPRHPLHPEYFSSNTLFGQPGIYPGGPAMAPATGTHLDSAGGRTILAEVLGPFIDPSLLHTTLAWFDDASLQERVPDAVVRTALLLLTAGPAEPVLQAFLHDATPVRTLGVGSPQGDGRVIGMQEERSTGPFAMTGDTGHRVLNQRYAAEHPALVAPSLAHALCHHGDHASNAEESTLHGLLAGVHTWLVALRPELATLGTELSRRQASLTITLLNARSPGSWRASIRCPDGPGTIPGGNPALQCPDLWSIPFTSLPDAGAALDVPDSIRSSLARLAGRDAPAVPPSYDDSLGAWLTAWMGDGAWFDAGTRARAGRALGLL